MSMVYDSELRPIMGLLFIPQMIYDSVELRWNDTDRKKPKNSKQSQCHFVQHKSHTDWPEREHGSSRLEAGD
jgi:hypothetical protein